MMKKNTRAVLAWLQAQPASIWFSTLDVVTGTGMERSTVATALSSLRRRGLVRTESAIRAGASKGYSYRAVRS
jgi:DNA-binding IclR family transcriptional regulator